MRRRRTRLVLTAVLALLPVAGQAGGFSSIEESVSAGAEINYVFERCAALHFAVLNHAGEIYEARFRNNYAETGQAFMQDALVNADLDFCKYLGDELNG